MALRDDIAILARTPVLDLLGEDALRILAFSAEARSLAAGATLFRRGERSDGAFVVMSGAVGVGREGGAETVLRSGSLIGRAALFVRMQRPAGAVAREESRLLRISPTLTRRVLQEFPDGAARVRDALAADLADLMRGIEAAGRSVAAIARDDAPRHAAFLR